MLNKAIILKHNIGVNVYHKKIKARFNNVLDPEVKVMSSLEIVFRVPLTNIVHFISSACMGFL